MRPQLALAPQFGSEFMWRKIRGFKGREFTAADLQKTCGGMKLDSVGVSLRRFVAAGYVEATGRRRVPGNNGARRIAYRCTKPDAKAPTFDYGSRGIRGERQRRLWTTIRTARDWTVEGLAISASDAELEITTSCAAGYVWALKKAGVVLCIVGKRALGLAGGTAPAVYKLNPRCNFGPEPPEVFRGRGVWDPNHRRWVGAAPAATVPA